MSHHQHTLSGFALAVFVITALGSVQLASTNYLIAQAYQGIGGSSGGGSGLTGGDQCRTEYVRGACAKCHRMNPYRNECCVCAPYGDRDCSITMPQCAGFEGGEPENIGQDDGGSSGADAGSFGGDGHDGGDYGNDSGNSSGNIGGNISGTFGGGDDGGDISGSTTAPPRHPCEDEKDNDGDGLIDEKDPGCKKYNGVWEGTEFSATTACQDGRDNDGDGLIDLEDPGCYGFRHNDNEKKDTSECQDGVDNDGDGLVDEKDSGCKNPLQNMEVNRPYCVPEKYAKEIDISMKVSYTSVNHSRKADYNPTVIVGGEKTKYSHQYIKLVKDGKSVVDEKVAYDAPWLSLQRGDGFIYVTFSNDDHHMIGIKALAGTITLTNGIFTKFEQDPRNSMKVDGQGDGVYSLGKSIQDEVLVKEGSVTARFGLTVDNGADGFYLYYKPFGACQKPVVIEPTPVPPVVVVDLPIVVGGLSGPVGPPVNDNDPGQLGGKDGVPDLDITPPIGLPVFIDPPFNPVPRGTIPERVAIQPAFTPEDLRSAAPDVTETNMICFASDGTVTSDRSECDSDAPMHTDMIEALTGISAVTLHGMSEEQEEDVEERMNQRFIGQQMMDTKRMNLMAVLSTAREKIERIHNSIAMSNEGMAFMDQSTIWVDDRLSDLSATEHSLENMNAMSEATKELIERIQSVVQQSQLAAPDSGVNIDSVTARVGGVLMKIYQALLVMSRENITVDQIIIDHYQSAMTIYNEVQATCPTNEEECARLADVITEIQLMKEPMEAIMENMENSPVKSEIETILESE